MNARQDGRNSSEASALLGATVTAAMLLTLFVPPQAVAALTVPTASTAQTAEGTQAADSGPIEGVLFADQPETLFAPVREVGERLGWPVRWDAGSETLYLGDQEVPGSGRRSLPDGTQVIPLRSLRDRDVTVAWDASAQEAHVRHADAEFAVRSGRRMVAEGVTFAEDEGDLYAPIRAVGQGLGWIVHWDAESEAVYLGDRKVPEEQLRHLPDGTRLISLRALTDWEAKVAWKETREVAQVTSGDRALWVREGEKRVAINREAQQMRAWQGKLMVLDTRVSTGRPGKPTPTGSYTAGPLKTPMLISRTYNDAEMPWSVQIRGDYVIHGFTSVPPRAASHGCVRVPLTGENPAKWFYTWVDVGTPITIADSWPDGTTVSSGAE